MRGTCLFTNAASCDGGLFRGNKWVTWRPRREGDRGVARVDFVWTEKDWKVVGRMELEGQQQDGIGE